MHGPVVVSVCEGLGEGVCCCDVGRGLVFVVVDVERTVCY